jgi:hypothetical protein
MYPTLRACRLPLAVPREEAHGPVNSDSQYLRLERKDCIIMLKAALFSGKTTTRLAIVILVLVAAVSGGVKGQDVVTITISPNQFVLDYDGSKISVHTNIPCGDVDRGTVELHNLDGASIKPMGFKCDDRGNLVVKFSSEDLAKIVSPPSAELTLTGSYSGGGSFSASDVIRVK